MKSMEELQQLVIQGITDFSQYGHVNTQVDGDLILFNYNLFAQIEGKWGWFERASRGLILNRTTGEVIARPYDKFYNWHENHMPKPNRRNRQISAVTEKMDGCFLGNTKLNLWDGGTITIREVVSKRLPVILKGMNDQGDIVPTQVIDWFDNGTKNDWLLLTVDCDVSDKAGTRTGNHIPITPNHHVYVGGEYKSAMDLKIGDILTSSQREPSEDVIHLINSGLLGDGSICKTHNAYKYTESHQKLHEEYVDYIIHWLGECSIKKDYRTSGYGSEMCRAVSKAYKSLRDLYVMWYRDGKKRIPEDLSWMDDFSVAKWYMDDGSLMHAEGQKDRAHFSTNSFSEEDCNRLANRLHQMYGVSAVVYFSKGWNIRVNYNNGSIDRLWRAISPFIIPCMVYKLPEAYRVYSFRVLRGKGREKIVPIDTKVISIISLRSNSNYFNAGKKGFDITTETGNYFCKGVLVHNSLGILYRNPEYKIATRGSFKSDQAIYATDMLYTKYDVPLLQRNVPDEATLMFEIIYPKNRIVVDYGTEECLCLIGARNRRTGDYYSYEWRRALAEQCGFRLPTSFDSLIEAGDRSVDHIESFIKDWTWEQEGVVVEFTDGSFWKFKSPEYCRVHKILSTINFKNVVAAYQAGSLDDTMALIPEHYRREVELMVCEIRETILNTHLVIEGLFAISPKEASRKEYAQWVMRCCPDMQHYMFARLDNKDLLPLIFKHEFNNRDNKHLVGDV